MTELGISEIDEFRKCEIIAFWENIIVFWCLKIEHFLAAREKNIKNKQ